MMGVKRLLGLFLLLVTVAIPNSVQWKDCGVRYGVTWIRRKGCEPLRVLSKGCLGECFSYSRPFKHKKGYAKSCSCCAPISSVFFKVFLNCKWSDGRKYKKRVSLPVPRLCLCRPCFFS